MLRFFAIEICPDFHELFCEFFYFQVACFFSLLSFFLLPVITIIDIPNGMNMAISSVENSGIGQKQDIIHALPYLKDDSKTSNYRIKVLLIYCS